MKTLQQIREASGGKEAYQKFFNSILTKFGVKSPAELDDDKKKDFYDAIDKGWDGDNEKPEKNEKMNQDDMDPETMNDADPDEKEINAEYMKAHKMNATYDKTNADTSNGVNAGYIKSAYHMKKESVNEKTKLKGGRGKAEVDINWVGDKKDIKFATTKYKIKIKPHSDGAIVTGDKQKILAYLTGQDYAMDDEDIEDLYPELMEGYNSPKPLSAITNRYTVSADITEKAYMCEQCGKMHEEGMCEYENLDPETTKVEAKAPKLSTSDMMKISKIADKNSGDMEKAIKLIDKVKKGASEHPDVMAMLKLANEQVNDYGSDKAVKAAKKKIPGQNEGVDVDRRTVGFKAAMIRNEKAKMQREKAKAKKAAKKDQAELDARYDYDGGVDDVLASANAAIFGTKLETAANAVAHGGVDMAPNAGKKKKDKEKIFARKY